MHRPYTLYVGLCGALVAGGSGVLWHAETLRGQPSTAASTSGASIPMVPRRTEVLAPQEPIARTGLDSVHVAQPYAAWYTFDLAADWSDASNPHGVWSYNQGNAAITSHLDYWAPFLFRVPQPAWALTASGPGHVPVWLKIVTTDTTEALDIPIGHVAVHSTDGSATTPEPANVTWTSPIDGVVEILGGVWLGRDIGRSVDWTLYVNGTVLTGGSLFTGDSYNSANPFDLADGSGGPHALTVPVRVNDVIKLQMVTVSSPGDFVGVNLSVMLRGTVEDAISREFSYQNLTFPELSVSDTVSREFSFENTTIFPPLEVTDVVSREFSYQSQTPPPPLEVVDVISREFSFHNNKGEDGFGLVDVVSREFSYENETPSPTLEVMDVVSREFSFQSDAPPELEVVDVISREFSYEMPLADLVVVNIETPADGTSQEPFSVRWTDENRGGFPAEGPWADRVYISADVVLDRNNDPKCGDAPYGGTLAPGVELPRWKACEWPIEPGCYYLIVETDVYDYDDVEEGDNEGNNVTVSASCVPVVPPPRPNLQVSDLIPPPAMIPGQSAPFSWTTRNAGTLMAQSPWCETVYLSRDGTIGNRERLADVFITENLAPQASADRTRNLRIATGLTSPPGYYKVVVCADTCGSPPYYAIIETVESDNCFMTAETYCFNCFQPDLVVLPLVTPGKVDDGQTLFFSWTVRNQGTGSAVGTWLDKVWLSSDAGVGNDMLLAELPHDGPLDAETEFSPSVAVEYSPSVAVTIPPGLHGSHYFIVCTDTENNVSEFGGENNNCRVANVATDVNQPKRPDLVVADVSGDNDVPGQGDPLYTGTKYNLFWRVRNAGPGYAFGSWTDKVYVSTDNQLDPGIDDQIDTPDPSFAGTLPPLGFYTQSVRFELPSTAGPYWIFVVTDATNEVPEEIESNNIRSLELNVIAPEYSANVETAVSEAAAGSVVELNGWAHSITDVNELVPNVPVTVRVVVQDTRRVFPVKTKADGTFTLKFQSMSGEAGVYKVFAEHPAAPDPEVPDDSFVLIGVQPDPTSITLHRTGTGEVSGSFTIRNLGDNAISEIACEGVEGSESIDVSFTSRPQSLPSLGSGVVQFTVNALAVPEPPNVALPATIVIKARVAGAPETVASVPVDTYVSPERSRLTVNPASLSATAPIGSQTLVGFDVTNVGGAPATDVEARIPCYANPGCTCPILPGCEAGGWLNAVTPLNLGRLAPGESKRVELALQPRSGVEPVTYSGWLTVQGTDGGLTVPFSFRVISTTVGALQVNVEDELSYYGFRCQNCDGVSCQNCKAVGCPECPECPPCENVDFLDGGGPLLAGADIRVYDAVDGLLRFSATTGESGKHKFENVPEGFYKVEVRAEQHGSFQQTIEVKAQEGGGTAAADESGVTTLTAFLPSNAVTYEWTVVPTEVEDEYTVTITATFETYVPVPVVEIKPTVIELDLLPGESKEVDLTIVNHGYIAAQGAELVPAAPTGYTVKALFTQIGIIPPGGIPIHVPMTIKRDAVAAASTAGADSGSCSESIPFGLKWYIICRVPIWHWTGCYYHRLRDCPGPSPGGGGACCGGGSPCPGCSPGNPYGGSDPIQTDDPTTCQEPKDPGNDGPPPCQGGFCTKGGDGATPTTGKPVYLFSGEEVVDAEDLRIPGRGMDFMWSRKYRSKAGPNTVQGNGWDFAYDQYITRGDADPNDGDTPEDIIFHAGTARNDIFKPAPGNKWTRREYFEEFSQNPDGSYTLTQADQAKIKFLPIDGTPAVGRVSSITDRNGNAIRFEYDAARRLVKIIDTLDREITVAYNADGKIASVTDFAGRQVKYDYYDDGEDINGDGVADGSFGDLKSVTTPVVVGTPNGDDFPAGKTTVYTYSKGFDNDRLNHNLLTITDAKGQTYLRNEYHPTTNPDDRNFDRVVRQIWGNDGDITKIAYFPLVASATNGQAVMRTIVNDRVGNVSEYFFDNRNRLIKKREYTGRANPDQPTTTSSNRPTGKLRQSDPAYFETLYEWNDDSLLTRKIEPNGTITENVYESSLDPNAPVRTRANLRESHRLQGSHATTSDQPSLVRLSQYDTEQGSCCGFNFPTTQTDARGHVTTHEYDDHGNRTKTTYPIAGVEESFEYNDFGQMTAHTLPDNGSGHRRRDEYVYYDSESMKGYLEKQIVDAGPGGFNLTTSYEYDAVGNVTKVTDPRGHDTQYAVNALNQVVRETSRGVDTLDNQGNPVGTVRYQRDTFYDANDNVARVDVQNVDDQGQLVTANPYFTIVYEYEILNNLIRKSEEVEEGRNIVTEYEYDGDRNRTLVRFGEATAGRQPDNAVAIRYDERNMVFQEIRGPGGADESAVQYDYDGNGNQIALRHGAIPTGVHEVQTDHVTRNEFDAYNRLARTTDAMGNVTSYSYDADGNRLSVLVEGELDDVPGGIGNVRLSETHYTHDAMNRLTQVDVAFFDTRTQASIEDGQATTITEYSPNSQVIRVTDDRGNETRTTYDSANRRQVVTDAKGNSVTYEYDGNSNVVTITEVEKSDLGDAVSPPETIVTLNEYDALDRLITTKDNLLNTNRSYYDSRNNRTRTVDALNHEVLYQYDGLNRLLRTIRDMDGSGLGSAHANARSGDPDLASQSIVTEQTWDDSSRLTSQTDDNGNTTTYVYDGLNRKTGEIYADKTEKHWRFDVHGNNVFWTDANGNEVTQLFDALDRRTDVDVIPGPSVSHDTTFEIYKYDGLGRLIYAQDDDSIVTRAYDSLSRVTTETQQYLDETPAVVRSVYDGVGNNTLLYYPSGRVVETTYDSLNRKKLIKDQGDSGFIAEYLYKGASRVERRDYGNHTRMDASYDAARRTTRTRHTVAKEFVTCDADAGCPSGNTCEVATQTCIIDDRTYAWDPMYNKTQMADVRPGGPLETRDYDYDPVYRLIQSDRRNSQGHIDTFVYQLDGVGNRIHVDGGTDAGDYIMDARNGDFVMNQYSTTPFDARRYDANGNLVEITVDDDLGGPGDFDLADFAHFQFCFGVSPVDGSLCSHFDADGDGVIGPGDWALLSQRATGPSPPSRTLSYDFANRETLTLDLATGGQFQYAYDALGRRISKTIESTEVESAERYISFIYQEIEESASPGQLTTHVYGNYIDELLQSRASSTIHAHVDQLFSVSAMTAGDASIAGTFSYGDYGTLGGSAWSATAYSFTGRRYDHESALFYYRTRYYEARLGRFVTRDQEGLWFDATSLGAATTFVGNNPVSRLDPFGRQAATLCEWTFILGYICHPACKVDESPWDWIHCVWNCKMRKKITSFATCLMADANEIIIQPLQCLFGQGEDKCQSACQQSDFDSNFAGLRCARSKEGCETCCTRVRRGVCKREGPGTSLDYGCLCSLWPESCGLPGWPAPPPSPSPPPPWHYPGECVQKPNGSWICY